MPEGPASSSRVQKLEESVGFIEHDVTGLRGAIDDLAARYEAALGRIAALERRLEAVEAPPEDEHAEPSDDE